MKLSPEQSAALSDINNLINLRAFLNQMIQTGSVPTVMRNGKEVKDPTPIAQMMAKLDATVTKLGMDVTYELMNAAAQSKVTPEMMNKEDEEMKAKKEALKAERTLKRQAPRTLSQVKENSIPGLDPAHDPTGLAGKE